MLVAKLPAVELEATLSVTSALAACESCRLIGAEGLAAVSVCGAVANESAG